MATHRSAASRKDRDLTSASALSAAELLRVYAATTLDAFLAEVHAVVSFTVPIAWVSAFYRRAEGSDGFLEERDSRGRVWRGRFMQRYAELTPAVPIVQNNRGVMLITTREALALPEPELRRSPIFNEIMQPQGWRHGAVMCFWTDPPGDFPIFVLSFYRTANQPDFTDVELEFLSQVHPYLLPAVNRFHHTAVMYAATEGMALALRHVPAGIVILDWQLRIVRSNPVALRTCAAWNPAVRGTASQPAFLPPDLLRRCHALRRATGAALRRSTRAHLPRLRAMVTSPSGVTASIAVVYSPSDVAEPVFVIELQHPGVMRAGPPVARSLTQLTESEREVAILVAEGRSNQETAEQLGKTVHAVKFLLHRVYTKLGVGNRVQLSVFMKGGAR